MELLFIGINIALLFGSLGGLIAILALPFLANMIVKNRNRVEELESKRKEDVDISNRAATMIEDEFFKLQRQVDSIESDLERAKLSSLTKSSQPAKLSNKPKVNSSAIKAKNIQDSVLHLANKKQGGKRANKSRNK
jgi:hypothetical protein